MRRTNIVSDLVDIPSSAPQPKHKSDTNPSSRNLMDDSINEIDIVGDSFGDSPPEPNEQQVPHNDQGEVPANPTVDQEDTTNQLPQPGTAQETSDEQAGPLASSPEPSEQHVPHQDPGEVPDGPPEHEDTSSQDNPQPNTAGSSWCSAESLDTVFSSVSSTSSPSLN